MKLLNKNTIAYIGPLLISLGVIRLMVYYWFFGVNILNFLTFSEIITSFFDVIIISVICFIVLHFLLVYAKAYDNKGLDDQIRADPEMDSTTLFFKIHTKKSVSNKAPVVMIILLLSTGPFLAVKNKEWSDLIYSAIIGAFLLLIFLLFRLVDFILEYNSILGNRLLYTRLVILVSVLLVVMGFTVTDVYNVKSKNRYLGTSIKFDDTEFVSDNLNYYIGNTQAYIFIYHEGSNETDVIPMTKVERITFKH